MLSFTSLASIADLTVGFVGTMAEHYEEAGVPFLRSLNIKPFAIDDSDIKYISNEFNQKIKKSILHTDDVVIVRTGVPGTCCVITEKYDGCNCSDLVIIHPNKKKVDPYYLAAYINFWGRKQISNNKVGAVQQHFNVRSAEEMLIALPTLEEQKIIADIIRSINAKIANNNAICADFEGMAKLLYDYWFVQFDFPDENGKPYKSSGGKMVWNDELKREIPEGWKVGHLKDLFCKINDGVTAENKGNYPYTPMDCLPMKQMTFGGHFDNDEANSSLIRYKNYDVLFGAMRAYFHRVCIAPYEGITRTTTFVLRPIDADLLGFSYETINQDVAVAYAVKRSVGTQQPYAEWENNFDSFAFAMPPKNLATRYSLKVQGVVDSCIHHQAENADLASLRDFLLPMLMNGQVKVKEAV